MKILRYFPSLHTRNIILLSNKISSKRITKIFNVAVFMHIIIDSTEYKKDRNLNSKNFSLIRDLGKRGLLTNHLPWFVYKECTTTGISESIQKIKDAISALRSLPRLGVIKNEIDSSELIIDELQSLEQKISSSVISRWKDYISASNSKLYEFKEKYSTLIFEDYFKGNKPFKTLKSRNDIPDAFIFQDIKELCNQVELFVISNDGDFRKAVKTLSSNVHTFKNLDEFFGDENFKVTLEKYNDLIDNEEKLKFINRYLLKFQPEIEEEVLEFINGISYLEFFDDKLKSDDKAATIQDLTDPIFQIYYDDIEIVGKEAFVPISVICNSNIEYAVFKADYWSYDDLPKYSEEINRHYYLIEDSVKLKLEQNVVINLEDVKINENEELGFVPFALDKFDRVKIL